MLRLGVRITVRISPTRVRSLIGLSLISQMARSRQDLPSNPKLRKESSMVPKMSNCSSSSDRPLKEYGGY